MAVQVPVWVAGLLAAGVAVSVISGEAKITTSDGCQEWLDEVAWDDFNEGYNPPDEASFYGLGIGICFLENTDA